MTIQRRGAAVWTIVLFSLLLVKCTSASAQTPPATSEPDKLAQPEQMVDDALKMIDAGDYEKTFPLLQKARVLNPNINKIKLADGLLLIARRHAVEAIDVLEGYNKTTEGQNDYRGYLAVARVYFDSLMYRQAVPAYEHAKKLAPLEENGRHVLAETTVELAMACLKAERRDKALEIAKEAQKLAPDDPKVLLRLAQIAESTQDVETVVKATDRAVQLLTTALRSDPLKRESYQLLEAAFATRRNLEKRDLDAKPEVAASYFKLAVTARNSAEVGRLLTLLDARDNMEQALAREPDNAEYLLFAARLEADLGAIDEAKARLDRVLKANPDSKAALELKDSLKPGMGGFTGK